MKDIKYIADLLDTKFQLPNGWRFGWDGILGFIPGVGNLITDVFSFYIVFRAAVLGCSVPVLLHMVFNIVIDNLVDKVPVLGLIIDFFWKANTKNVTLLENYLANPEASKKHSKIFLAVTAAILIIFFLGTIAISFAILLWLFALTFKL